MSTKHIEYGQSVDVIFGPSERTRNELRTAVIDLAEHANHRAAESFAIGRVEAGAIYLSFAERLTLIGGQRP